MVCMMRNRRVQISISTFLVLAAGVFIWQYLENQESKKPLQPESFQESVFTGVDQDEEDQDEGEEALDADDPLNIPDTPEQERQSSAYVVNQEICDSECSRYHNDPEALTYYQTVCGLAPTEGGQRETPEQCNTRSDTARDICYRDKAVAEKNPDFCKEIVDKTLRQSCYNRLAEEQFDRS